MNLDSFLESIPRISPIYKKRLNKLRIKTLRDLFYHFPYRYDDFSKITPIDNLKLNEIATIQGKVLEIKNIRSWRKKMFITEAYIRDPSGVIKAIWFNQPYLTDILKKDTLVSLSGKVNFDKALYLSNPAYERIVPSKWQIANDDGKPDLSNQPLATGQLRHTGRLIPVYPETAGLSSRYIRYLVQLFLPTTAQIKDWLPPEIKKTQQLVDLKFALKQIHFPSSTQTLSQAKRRLAFNELFLIQLSAFQRKIKWQKERSRPIPFNEFLVKEFVGRLPFKLTNAQRKAAWEILKDLNKSRPMNRLLEGDVGSGKTVVAAIAALETVQNKAQVAFMAPTEILARQHFNTLEWLLDNYNLKIGLLLGSEAKIFHKNKIEKVKKADLAKKIKNGEIDIAVGTHALIQKNVKFKNLALAVVDEQHRFGVEQRATLQKPKMDEIKPSITAIDDGSVQKTPHLLSMTATPIPRTLALTIYGDLDISLLDELPPGRQEIITRLVAPTDRQKAYEFVQSQVKAGRQVFVICPRIENKTSNGYGDETRIVESLTSDVTALRNEHRNRSTLNDKRLAAWDEVKTVKQEYEKLNKIIFPDLKIAALHGKMKPKEKEKIMLDFKNGKTDVLISTSVIEVGIDVPNATVMLIEGADRFGLAQLHQFRGRVGRGAHQSYCLLFTESSNRQTRTRLKALLDCKNGFELAEKDLTIRGPGEFFGARQWGLPDLSMASLNDIALISACRQEAAKLLKKDPALKNYPLLAEKIKEFKTIVHLE